MTWADHAAIDCADTAAVAWWSVGSSDPGSLRRAMMANRTLAACLQCQKQYQYRLFRRIRHVALRQRSTLHKYADACSYIQQSEMHCLLWGVTCFSMQQLQIACAYNEIYLNFK